MMLALRSGGILTMMGKPKRRKGGLAKGEGTNRDGNGYVPRFDDTKKGREKAFGESKIILRKVPERRRRRDGNNFFLGYFPSFFKDLAWQCRGGWRQRHRKRSEFVMYQ